jgi:hypothetical protein
MLAVDEAMGDIAQYNPMSTRLYLRGQIWNFVKSNDANEHGLVMGDIIPDYWIPTSVEGKAPLIFMRKTRYTPPPLRDHFQDCDADDKGGELWWDRRVQGGYFLPDNMRPPTIVGPDPAESNTDIVARINDFGSNKAAKKWVRAKARREKALKGPLMLEDLQHHEPITDVVIRKDFGRNKHAAQPEMGDNRPETQFEDLLGPVESRRRESSRFGSPNAISRHNVLDCDNQAASPNRGKHRCGITFKDLLMPVEPSPREPCSNVIVGGNPVGNNEHAAKSKRRRKRRGTTFEDLVRSVESSNRESNTNCKARRNHSGSCEHATKQTEHRDCRKKVLGKSSKAEDASDREDPRNSELAVQPFGADTADVGDGDEVKW